MTNDYTDAEALARIREIVADYVRLARHSGVKRNVSDRQSSVAWSFKEIAEVFTCPNAFPDVMDKQTKLVLAELTSPPQPEPAPQEVATKKQRRPARNVDEMPIFFNEERDTIAMRRSDAQKVFGDELDNVIATSKPRTRKRG